MYMHVYEYGHCEEYTCTCIPIYGVAIIGCACFAQVNKIKELLFSKAMKVPEMLKKIERHPSYDMQGLNN